MPRSHTTHRIIPMPDETFSAIGGSVTSGNSINITVNEPLVMTPNNHFAYIFLYAIDGNGTVVTAMQIYRNDNGNLVSHKTYPTPYFYFAKYCCTPTLITIEFVRITNILLLARPKHQSLNLSRLVLPQRRLVYLLSSE